VGLADVIRYGPLPVRLFAHLDNFVSAWAGPGLYRGSHPGTAQAVEFPCVPRLGLRDYYASEVRPRLSPLGITSVAVTFVTDRQTGKEEVQIEAFGYAGDASAFLKALEPLAPVPVDQISLNLVSID
jgi:hypothetical protein